MTDIPFRVRFSKNTKYEIASFVRCRTAEITKTMFLCFFSATYSYGVLIIPCFSQNQDLQNEHNSQSHIQRSHKNEHNSQSHIKRSHKIEPRTRSRKIQSKKSNPERKDGKFQYKSPAFQMRGGSTSNQSSLNFESKFSQQ